jgi:hypothetical protein
MTVTVQQFGGKLKVKLDADQRYLFTQELRRVQRYFPHEKGSPRGMYPDCTVTVSEKGKKEHYALYGQAILFEVKTNRRRQFYFGLLLLRWLGP